MDESKFEIGAKIEHPHFGVGVITNYTLTSLKVFFQNRGEKDIARDFKGLKLLEASNAEQRETGGGSGISLSDLEKVFTGVLRCYADFPGHVEMADRWKKGVLILKPGSEQLKPKELPLDNFFNKIILLRERLRVLEQRINNHEKLDDQDKINLQQYITRIYGSLTTFNVLFKNKEQYFTGERGGS